MDNIRLPEDFTDRVMQRIEVRERAAARRTRLHSVLTTPAGPVTGIVLAVFLLALAGLLHDRRSSRHDIRSSVN